ncbi:hypothetical protein HNP48_002298 [Acidovorax soli]|uniref:Uncharacterized protein n=1 Tax=Acidovorax soli TaxID=592050 RepID=A0A7X0PD58_9BURK|nr:hypothetical protein [Acidovorax soli]MBB6559631.1 hypothetical protein [Acidovorax soli]
MAKSPLAGKAWFFALGQRHAALGVTRYAAVNLMRRWPAHAQRAYGDGRAAALGLRKHVSEADGSYFAECCRCGRDYELPCDLHEFNPEFSYCGGSLHCIP